MDFGQLIEAFGTNEFAQISHSLRQFCKCVKIYHFVVKSFLGNFYRHLAIFFWSHCLSIKLRLECFVIVEWTKQYVKALAYSPNDSKIQGCLWCQYFNEYFQKGLIVISQNTSWRCHGTSWNQFSFNSHICLFGLCDFISFLLLAWVKTTCAELWQTKTNILMSKKSNNLQIYSADSSNYAQLRASVLFTVPSEPVWPEWAIFESSKWYIFFPKQSKYLAYFGIFWKTSIFK